MIYSLALSFYPDNVSKSNSGSKSKPKSRFKSESKSNSSDDKSVGVIRLLIYYFSAIVGVGIFLTPIAAFRIAGAASVFSWIIVLLMVIPIGICFSKVARDYPQSGGLSVVIRKGLGDHLGSITFLFLLFTMFLGNQLLGLCGAEYILTGLGVTNTAFYENILAFCIISFCSVIAIGGISLSTSVQGVSLFVLVGLMICVCFDCSDIMSAENLYNSKGDIWNTIYCIGTAVTLCFYSIIGWENMNAISGTVKNPERTYRLAVVMAIILIALFYLMIVFLLILCVPADRLSSAITVFSALLDVNSDSKILFIGNWVVVLMVFIGLITWIIGTSYTLMAAANDGLTPKFIAHKRKGVPRNGILTLLFLHFVTCIIEVLFELDIKIIVEFSGLNYMVVYSIIYLACCKLYFKDLKMRILSIISLTIILMFIPFNLSMASASMYMLCLVAVYYFIMRKCYS